VKGRLVLLVVGLILAFAPSAGAMPRHVTVKEARRLVLVQIRSWKNGAEHLPGFEIDHESDVHHLGYIFFSIMWQGACIECGSNIGHFAVEQRDADVVDPVLCEEVTNTALRLAQRNLRRAMGLGREAYLRFRSSAKPICGNPIELDDSSSPK